jgi:GT2 family glycosyltransferase
MERSFYVGEDSIEAARFIETDSYRQVGGFNETITGGEDWDLSRRVSALGDIARVQTPIRHNEGRVRVSKSARKMYYYGQHAGAYFAANPTPSALRDQSGPLARYKLFLSHPRILLRHPFVAAGMLIFKTTEYAAAGLGYWRAKAVALEDARES